MTNLKDKLSASVRMAKASQQPATKPVVAKAAPAKAPAKQPAVRKALPSSKVQASVNQEGNSALFPSRVWPD